MLTTLFTLKTPSGEMHVKPENMAKMQAHLAKCAKGIKPSKPKACKRLFPNTSQALSSTAAYVAAYLELNYGHRGVSLTLIDDGTVYSTNPTVWPDPSLDTVEVDIL